MFQHDREPDPQWQEELNRIAPPADRATWLKLVWMPGMPYEPVQRWVIYEMISDLNTVSQEWLDEMGRGPPRLLGHWDSDSEVVGGRRWVSDSLVSQLQYDLYHQHRAWPQLLWVVQGGTGGHLWQLTQWQSKLFQLKHSGEEWPGPGTLEYAEPNQQTYNLVAKHDVLRAHDFSLEEYAERWDGRALLNARGKRMDSRLEAERRALNSAVAEWLDEQFYAIRSLAPAGFAKPAWEDAPEAGDIDTEQIGEEFVNG